MSISEVTPAPPTRIAAQAPTPPVRPAEAPAPLEPAVRLDIRAGDRTGLPPEERERPQNEAASAPRGDERRITVDRDTKSVVYQVVDPSSGDVVVQLPDASVLKTRAYAAAQAAHKQAVDRPLDRKA